MKPATIKAIDNVHGFMQAKYPGFDNFNPNERLLLTCAYLADVVKVREIGNNRGEWVDVFLDAAGVPPGNPWCASLITFAAKVCGLDVPSGAAAVRNWNDWATKKGKKVSKPQRGDICMKNSGGGKGHVGIVVKVIGPLVYSIEGNTSPGEGGSQRDGDGLYRRVRTKGFWSWGFARL